MTRKPLIALTLSAALAGCVTTAPASSQWQPGELSLMNRYDRVAACLVMIENEFLPGAAYLFSDWPDLATSDEGLAAEHWYGSYSPLSNTIHLRSPDVYPSEAVYDSVICHEAYHFASFKIRGIRNPDCEEAEAYTVALRWLDEHAGRADAEYVAEQRTLQARHQAACEAG